MGKLSLLEELEIMVKTGELTLEMGREEGGKLLQDIKMCVIRTVKEEVRNDITALDTAFYAPEYPNWAAFLINADGGEDYTRVLLDNFTQQELELLWQNSHISEDMTEQQIQDEFLLQIGQLKTLSMIAKLGQSRNPEKTKQIIQGIIARITGLYNILYE